MTYTKHETRAIEGRRTTFNLFDSSTAMALHYKAQGFKPRCSFGNEGPTLDAALRGDLKAAAVSDAFMAKFEALNLVSTGFVTRDDVVGAVPNIGAFLTGSPMNMRLRRRTMKEAAPLAIVCDLTTSAGIDADSMSRRGSVILAAARILSATRPVELWAFVGLGHKDGGAVFAGHRIETSPIDLARAAPVFADHLWARNVGYATCDQPEHGGANGAWPYNRGRGPDAEQFEKIMRHALPHLGDTLAIPSLHLHDELLSNPEQWLRNVLAKYRPEAEAA
jgi:hypothetical protein